MTMKTAKLDIEGKPPSWINGKQNPEYAKWYRKTNAEAVRAGTKKWRDNNKVAIAESKEKRLKENPDYYSKASSRWRANNPEKHRAKVKKWNESEKGKLATKKYQKRIREEKRETPEEYADRILSEVTGALS